MTADPTKLGSFAIGAHEGECARCKRTMPLRAIVVGDDAKIVYRSVYCDTCLPIITAEEEAARHERQVTLLLNRSGMSRRLATFTFESHPNQRAVARCREWLTAYLTGERRNLILTGGIGVGKTGLAWPLVRALCEHEVPAVFANVRDLLNEIRASFNSQEGDAADEIPARLERAAVACLDDLGSERPTEWARDRLATLIERRYQEQMPTIITTNYDEDALARRLGYDDPIIGKRIVSRLQEDALTFTISGDDRRVRRRPTT